MQDELRNRLHKIKEELGISYKKIAEVCGIPKTTLYAFSGDYRKLNDEYAEVLSNFLRERGY